MYIKKVCPNASNPMDVCRAVNEIIDYLLAKEQKSKSKEAKKK